MMINQYYATGLSVIRHMNMNMWASQKAMMRLSTGLRINSAADDAAGLAISEKMRGQIKGLEQAARNIQDGISLLQTAEGGLHEVHAMLQRMREISVQAANDTNSPEDRQHLQNEYEQLLEEITRISRDTQFNTIPLLDGSKSSLKIQAGANSGQTIELHFSNMSGAAIGLAGTNILTREAAEEAMSALDEAINKVASQRSSFGAMQNRLEHALNNTLNMQENLVAAESRIRDADMAKELMNFTKANLLMQAAQYVLAMHMQQAQSMLQLLKVGLNQTGK